MDIVSFILGILMLFGFDYKTRKQDIKHMPIFIIWLLSAMTLILLPLLKIV